MQTLIGAKIGDYDIEAEIGRGAMGVVYRARQFSLDRPVALKVLSPLLAADASFVERFKREGTIAATLDHPSIVRVYEAGAHLDLDTGERLHYFAMQYIEGETVHDRLQREGQLPLDETVAIAVHIAQALDYAWRKARLIHRDIKPSNIFLSANGEVKLGDLGLARSAGDSQGGAGLTATGNVVGTAYFMSPEQARGERGLDFRSDIYGLGCMLYRMLCGRHLYEGPFASVLAQHLTEPPPSLRMVLPDCPVELASVIEKMLAKHPSGRQQSYDELITELRRVHEQITSGAAEGGSRPPSAISAALSSASAPSRKLLPVILYTAMTTTTIIVLAGVLVWAPWKQSEQQPVNSEAAKARGVPVTQTFLSAAAESPKPASEASPPGSESRLQAEAISPAQLPAKAGTPNPAARNGALQAPPSDAAVENRRSLEPSRAAEAAPTFQQPPAIETPALPAKPVAQLAQATPPPAPATPAAQPAAPQPADEAFVKSVSAMPPEQQVQAVIAKLKELNTNFDGKETHKIESGVVTTLSFSTVGVTDISPVKALRWLRTLTITPPALNQKGSVENLAPLQGMQLTWLWCHNNPITDLSPLKGMPLTVLSFSGTQVNDLAPLTGMKLQVLSFNDTVISELGPLEGMPLTVLWCNNTKVTDLTPLKAMPLKEIKCDFVAERDAAILRGIRTLAKINDQPAGAFWMRAGPVSAATITKSGHATGPTTTQPPTPKSVSSGLPAQKQIDVFVAKMKELNPGWDGRLENKSEAEKVLVIEMTGSAITNISPVRILTGLKLKTLSCHHSNLSDLSPVKGLSISFLGCNSTEVRDLSPLKNMELTGLHIAYTKVTDLSPLRGMHLTSLFCYNTGICDLTPLKGMPLTLLYCQGSGITDLSPLKGMTSLTDLKCDFVPDRDSKILRSIKSLRNINGMSTSEFWKRVDAGEAPQAK
jgi:serine/threonine-protein kinase